MIQAVSFDAYNTLLEMDRPFKRLQNALVGKGIDASLEDVTEALIGEMEFYRAHHLEGRDKETLRRLRISCASVLFDGLAGLGIKADIDPDGRVDILLSILKFHVFEDVLPALKACRRQGLRLAITSNWDGSLPEILETLELVSLFDTITISALEGIAKPDPELFELTAARLGLPPKDVLHAGDDVRDDKQGALAAGMTALHLDRTGRSGDISSLGGIPELTSRLKGKT